MSRTQIIRNIKNNNDIDNNKKKSKDDDSSDISSYDDNYDNMTLDEVSQKGKEKFFKTELMEKIIKYIKIDDTIKDKQKELRLQMKALKEQKLDMEKYIISYLDAINEDYVNIEGTAKLTKTTTNTKGAIKVDNIKVSVIDGIKQQNINLDEKKINELLESILDSVDKNRPVKTKTSIRRTNIKNKKDKDDKKDKKNQDNNSSDEDIPKYSNN